MKVARNKLVAEFAKELIAVREQKRTISEREEQLKSALRDYIGDDTAIRCQDLLVIVTSVTRTDLDRHALQSWLGPRIHEFEIQHVYDKLEVRHI